MLRPGIFGQAGKSVPSGRMANHRKVEQGRFLKALVLTFGALRWIFDIPVQSAFNISCDRDMVLFFGYLLPCSSVLMV